MFVQIQSINSPVKVDFYWKSSKITDAKILSYQLSGPKLSCTSRLSRKETMAQLIADLRLWSLRVIWTHQPSRYVLWTTFYDEYLKKNLLNRSLALFGRYYQNVDWADPENTPDDNVMSTVKNLYVKGILQRV